MATLTGKKALVLGGSRGIGAAIVERLAADGAETTFTYGGSAEAAQALADKTGAKTVQADSADRVAVGKVIADRGALDILVVNAGVGVLGPALELDPKAVDRMIDINVRGPYHAAVDAARQMHDGGRIVIIGSVNGDRMPFPGGAAYALTKSAVQGMVRGLARDFGDRGITVNSVQPGPVNTDLNPEDGPMKELMHSFMAIKRHAQPEEIAGMVAYLVGPEAAIVTGAQHSIDGGFGA
ncbi:SDR family oxidoreductase [Romeria aff. gracilis LEGE 07310]|uniref:SDR family oxidoreductase n=1 Tax=Vasconcelosia minhoensis LEGE 07310 TaxID=915328 RepID=A0A8J7A766_9CYAN|nr:SDR family oxidoreductase [Romeria gracilis]MBE9077320.1 SDR family oxidoreductase [Romeria aff. gracilis LEGE 07310]